MRYFCFILAFTAATSVSAQSFAKKDHALQWNNGFHIVNFFTEQKDTVNIINADAASRHTSLQYEWGLNSWLGIGVFGRFVNYFTATDSGGARPNYKSTDFGLVFSGHFAPNDKFDFSGQMLLGASNMNFRNNKTGDLYNTFRGRGLTGSLRLNGRYYIKDFPLAIGMYYGLTAYKYSPVTDRNDIKYDIDGFGPDMGISLSLRLRPKNK